MPGNIKDPIVGFASKIVVVVVAIEEGWKFKLNLVEKKRKERKWCDKFVLRTLPQCAAEPI